MRANERSQAPAIDFRFLFAYNAPYLQTRRRVPRSPIAFQGGPPDDRPALPDGAAPAMIVSVPCFVGQFVLARSQKRGEILRFAQDDGKIKFVRAS